MPTLAAHRNDQIRSALGAAGRRGAGQPGWLPELPDALTREEFLDLLERNGLPGIADDAAAGMNFKQATARAVGRVPLYLDGEGRYVQDIIDDLHGLPEEDRRQILNEADATEWVMDHLQEHHGLDLSRVDDDLLDALEQIPACVLTRNRSPEAVGWIEQAAQALRDAGFTPDGNRDGAQAAQTLRHLHATTP